MFDHLPVWLLFGITVLIVVASIEGGYRMGVSIHRRKEDEKESSVSTIAASVLGLLAFILAFTFGIVTDRFDARKTLVREEASAIRTAYLRSDFLPQKDRKEACDLFREYVDSRLKAAHTREHILQQEARGESDRIHDRLWAMAVEGARRDMNSDVAALYIEALNTVINLHAQRIAVVQLRIPAGIWGVLYALLILGMLGLGYQTAIAGSRRSWIIPVLALAFSIVVAMIASLDSPYSGFIPVSQQPLEDLRASLIPDASDTFLDPGGGAQRVGNRKGHE